MVLEESCWVVEIPFCSWLLSCTRHTSHLCRVMWLTSVVSSGRCQGPLCSSYLASKRSSLTLEHLQTYCLQPHVPHSWLLMNRCVNNVAIHTYTHNACIHTLTLHTDIHTYTHTYIHTHTHTHNNTLTMCNLISTGSQDPSPWQLPGKHWDLKHDVVVEWLFPDGS